MDKTFNPAVVEPRISAIWEQEQAFRAGRPERKDAQPFTIVIPPPNVTGSLHMGHALNNTLQDILCRYYRMKGRDVLWQPGTDHAGIATQMVVERKLAAEKRPDRRKMGREAFLKEIWTWKEESGGAITNQLKRLGASCDWSRERFTMDEGLSRAVRKVFVELYQQGLIYRAKRLVNWDPKFQSAISDLEVQQVELKSHMYYFDYPLDEDPSIKLTIATTRPETMLGDGAVAVHPDDERYRHLVGKMVRLPLANRLIPVIADAYADPEKGSGAVKITPAHDFNDFKVGERHGLPLINLMTPEAKMNEACPPAYQGLDRFAARKQIIADIEALGLLNRIEPITHAVPHGDRSGVVIEPYLTDQWYVDAKTLAQPALAAVREGKTRFVPKNWEKTYFDWLENIEPWCISRQLWWGHQIPAWFGPDGHIFVAETEAAAQAEALAHYGRTEVLVRDEDVLDTWFSSALWPFSTLGWPDETPEIVARYYPTSVLVTGFDIIFFWVARMMMMGLHFKKEVPFADVYIHALVRDEKGAKMSKSKGNVIDPLSLIDTYGADALRFTLAAMAAQGRDIKLSTNRVEGYRNFTTKIWNAARFAEMNSCSLKPDFKPQNLASTLNQWVVAEAAKTAREIGQAIEAYRFNDAANGAYRFVWNIFCDWYLELAKPVLQGEDGPEREETRATVAFVLDQIIMLLHPFMPFMSEELWAIKAQEGQGEEGKGRPAILALSRWPDLSGMDYPQAEAEINWVVDVISEVRSVRSEMNVPATAQIPLVLVGAGEGVKALASRWASTLARMARVPELVFEAVAPVGSAQLIVQSTIMALPLAGTIDFDAERMRLTKEANTQRGEIAKIDAKLGNADFVRRAPEEVVEENRERRIETEARLEKILAALKRLG